VKSRWIGGNRVRLLENGEGYFPAVFDAIASARREVVLETFILFEDKVGLQLRDVLVAAASRGVQIDVLLDGFGSPDLTPEFILSLTSAGVRLRVFDPAWRLFGFRVNVLRRMHRKIVVIDAQRAFIGGINFSVDHLAEFGPLAKQDYAVEVVGPVVAHVHRFVHGVIRSDGKTWWSRPHRQHHASATEPRNRDVERAQDVPEAQYIQAGHADAGAIFVTRDNHQHRNDIERHYRVAIRGARTRVVVANAYFFPGYLLLRELRRAARRGVRVTLILQGEPDMPIVKTAAGLLYRTLQTAGVRIFEYTRRPLHGKVAVVDDVWSTVGSSNLDPLSLALNLEANLIIRDAAFTRDLGRRLDELIARDCAAVAPVAPASRWAFWLPLRGFLVFHFLRGFASWANWLPHHTPILDRPGKRLQSAALPDGQDGHGAR